MNVRTLTAGFVALAALAGSLSAAALSSAASAQPSTVVKTFNCHVSPANIDTMVQVKAWPTGASVATGDPSAPEPFVSFTTHDKGYSVGGRCHDVSKHVVFSRNDLVASKDPDADCSAPAHVWIKLELGLDGDGKPKSAKIEITQPHAKLKPLAQLQWTVDGSTTYHRPITCTTHN
jgi:hypothetical protein